MKALTLALLCILFFGCASTNKYPPGGLDEKALLSIAHQAIAVKEGWGDQAKYEKPKRTREGTWSVRVTRIPEGPGGHRFIVIDQQGNVTGYFRDR